MSDLNDVTVVIRAAGERTESLCIDRLTAQGISQEQFFVIHERPFSRAMKASYTRGLEERRQWTFCLDADVLLRNGALHDMLKAAGRLDENVIVVSALLKDKLFGNRRRVGNHLFRTTALSLMLERIAPFEEESIRPESSIIGQLVSGGYQWKTLDLCAGLHDYEQYYRDLARKSFVHARKHQRHLSELVYDWTNLAKTDPDFSAVLIGLSAGIAHSGEVKIDTGLFEDLAREVASRMEEKGNDPDSFEFRTDPLIRQEMDRERHSADHEFFQSRNRKIFRKMFVQAPWPELFRLFASRLKRVFR